jgi:hypothetical protein
VNKTSKGNTIWLWAAVTGAGVVLLNAEPIKAPREFIVVDRVERPFSN